MKNRMRPCARLRAYDLVGKLFGKLLVIKRENVEDRSGVFWRCRCECGNEIVVRSNVLIGGKKKSCGCDKSIIGKKFGELTVIEKVESVKDHHARYLCQCSCGKIKTIIKNKLINREDKGCRCHRYNDFVGQKFGKATVIERMGTDKHRNALWKCICDDGSKIVVRAEQLYRFEKRSKQVSEG